MTDKTDIVEQLRELAALKTGDPMPSWLPQLNWGPALSELAGKAANEIEFLRKRAGVVSGGDDLKAIKDRVHPERRRRHIGGAFKP